MTEKPSDDIFALCSRFDLDQESYRVFPKREPLALSTNNPEPSTVSVEAQLEDTSYPVAAACPDGEEERPPASQTSRTALRNLWCHLEHPETTDRDISFDELLKSSVFVYGTAGGVGATTVCATLARLFAKAGKHCAIVDDRNESVLPFFFGDQRGTYAGKRYPGLYNSLETTVRIIKRKVDDLDLPNGESETHLSWFQRNVSPIQKYLDHLVVDIQRGQEAALPAPMPVALFVAIPDVSSLVGARALKRIVSEQANGSKLICVLNKFDPSQALHTEIHGWFQENFSQVLTLGRSDLVTEALAEGLTVVDWAPQSTIATDFLHLLTTIQNMIPVSSHSQYHEGAALCS